MIQKQSRKGQTTSTLSASCAQTRTIGTIMNETLTLEHMSYGPAAIARSASGKTVFVQGGAPQECVEAHIDKQAKHFDEAQVCRIVTPSPHRVETPSCTQSCGGCPWAHLSYTCQLEEKYLNVLNAFIRTGKLELSDAEVLVRPPIASPRTWGYRNKIELEVGLAQTKNASHINSTKTSGNPAALNPQGVPDAQEHRLVLGFHRANTHSLAEVDVCPLAVEAIQNAPRLIKDTLEPLTPLLLDAPQKNALERKSAKKSFSRRRNSGRNKSEQNTSFRLKLFRIGVRHSTQTNQTHIALWTTPGAFPEKEVTAALVTAFPDASIIRIVAQPGKKRIVEQVLTLKGTPRWHEKLEFQSASCDYFTAAPSFFQVNSKQAETLVNTALDFLQYAFENKKKDSVVFANQNSITKAEASFDDLPHNAPEHTAGNVNTNADDGNSSTEGNGNAPSSTTPLSSLPQSSCKPDFTGKHIADLYAGGGTFSIPLAKAGAQVCAIEIAESSTTDLRENMHKNGVSLEIRTGDTAKLLPQLSNLDALIVDPPRSGLGDGVIASIAATHTPIVVYVSCDPQTLARDIARFAPFNYHPRIIQPVDLFPQTYHVETVVLLSGEKIDGHISINLDIEKLEGILN